MSYKIIWTTWFVSAAQNAYDNYKNNSYKNEERRWLWLEKPKLTVSRNEETNWFTSHKNVPFTSFVLKSNPEDTQWGNMDMVKRRIWTWQLLEFLMLLLSSPQSNELNGNALPSQQLEYQYEKTTSPVFIWTQTILIKNCTMLLSINTPTPL